MMSKRRTYASEFKVEAVRLVTGEIRGLAGGHPSRWTSFPTKLNTVNNKYQIQELL